MKRIFIIICLFLVTSPEVRSQVTYERSSSIVTIEGASYYVHTVKRGETIFSLSRLYGVSEDDIRHNNPLIDGLQAGQVIKVPAVQQAEEKLSNRKMNRLFDSHTVNQGETLYAISRRYEIPVNVLLEDNPGLDPVHMSVGQVLNIRKKSKGDATEEQIAEQINEYRDAVNSVSSDAVYHVVERGETLFGISRMYDVTEDDIIRANDLTDGLKAGAMIKIPLPGGGAAVPGFDDGPGYGDDPFDSRWDDGQPDGQYIPGWGGLPYGKDVTVKDFSQVRIPKVAVMLPLRSDNNSNGGRNFLEFYQGFLIGLEELKEEGVSAEVTLYNTGRSEPTVYGIIESPDFRGTDLIIGPVYEDLLGPVMQYAVPNGVPVVSPLASFGGRFNPLLYQMAPTASTKYEKLRTVFEGDKNIIYISSSNPDEEMENEIRPLIPGGYPVVAFDASTRSAAISDKLDRNRENVIFISCSNELAADQILAMLSSIQSNMLARSMSLGNITVVVSARWNRFGANLERNLYFKLGLCYVTNYHADRGDERIRLFDKKFITAFSSLPSLYSYRGYDAAKMFVGATHGPGDYTAKLNASQGKLLESPYRFVMREAGGSYVNDQWSLVRYRNDYTIVVE